EVPLSLVLCLVSQQVRETETWMPMKTSQAVGMSTRGGDLEASGDSPTGSDFGFRDDDDDDYSYDDDEDYEEFSGSGDRERPVRPTVNEVEIVKNSNQIPHLRNENPGDDQLSNVLMSHTGEDSILSKTEFLAALIAALAVGLMFAVLLILFLIYRMKKKDEGSYDLSKKPIYKKAPTTEIYA
uniref:Syndecan n=1 Tax=Amphilophus citrinellus TaxID=61819 RepID=A0A3Q0S4P1_AMPCI